MCALLRTVRRAHRFDTKDPALSQKRVERIPTSLSSTKPPALISRKNIPRAFCVQRRDTIVAGASAMTAA